MGKHATGSLIFGGRLRELREFKNLSQGDLAKLVGVRPGHISHFELGRRGPSLNLLISLADVLQTSLDYLTGRTNSKNSKVRYDLGNSITKRIVSDVSSMELKDQRTVEVLIRALKGSKRGIDSARR